MRKNLKGEALCKRIALRVFLDGGQKTRDVQIAPPGKLFTPEGIQQTLDQFSDYLEKRYPLREFRMVQVGPGAFNFIQDAVKETPAEERESVAATNSSVTTQSTIAASGGL